MGCCGSRPDEDELELALALKKDLESTFHSFMRTYCIVDPTCFVPYDIFKRAWDHYKAMMGDGELERLFNTYKQKYEALAGPIQMTKEQNGIHYDPHSHMVIGLSLRSFPL